MRILHVVRDLELSSEGISRSVPQLAKSLQRIGLKSVIVAGDYGKACVDGGAGFGEVEVLRLGVESKWDRRRFSSIRRRLEGSPCFDVIHVHGIWSGICHEACVFATRMNIPYVISPRGMLEPRAIEHKKWKKRLAYLLYQSRDLKNADVLHATHFKSDEQSKNVCLAAVWRWFPMEPRHLFP